jgi:hypothetical protein
LRVPDVLVIGMRLPPLVVAMLAENECVPLAQLKPQCAADGLVTVNGAEVLEPLPLRVVRIRTPRVDGAAAGAWRTTVRCTAAVGADVLLEAAKPVMIPATAARPRMLNRAIFLLFDRRGGCWVRVVVG